MGLVDCWKWEASLLSSFFLNLKLLSRTSPFLLSWTSNCQVVLLAFLQTRAQVIKSYFSLSSKLNLKLSICTGTEFAIHCFYTDWEQRQVQNGPQPGWGVNTPTAICVGTLGNMVGAWSTQTRKTEPRHDHSMDNTTCASFLRHLYVILNVEVETSVFQEHLNGKDIPDCLSIPVCSCLSPHP